MNNHIDAKTITEIMAKLIGPTWPVGDTTLDDERLINLKTLIAVTDWCLDSVRMSAELIGAPEFSVHANATTANYALSIWKEWLEGGCIV